MILFCHSLLDKMVANGYICHAVSDIDSKLKNLRDTAGLTLQQVVDKLVERGHAYSGSRQTISRWESRPKSVPSVVVSDLAVIYGVSSDVVLEAIKEDQADG